MNFEISILAIFSTLVFFQVFVRTYLNTRKSTSELPFFIGQLVYGMMWFGAYAYGAVLVFEAKMYGNSGDILSILFIYGFLTALASTILLILQKHNSMELDAKAKAQMQEKTNKILSFRRNKGSKHLK